MRLIVVFSQVCRFTSFLFGGLLITASLLLPRVSFAEFAELPPSPPSEKTSTPQASPQQASPQEASIDVQVLDMVPSSAEEFEKAAEGAEVPIDAERAIRGFNFIENQEEILGTILETGRYYFDHLENLTETHGTSKVRSWLNKNQLSLALFRFENNVFEYGKDMRNNADVLEAEKRNGKLLFKAEPTQIEVKESGSSRFETVLRVVDYSSGICFILFDPSRIPVDNPHLMIYAARQRKLAGKSMGRRGLDTMFLGISFDELKSEPVPGVAPQLGPVEFVPKAKSLFTKQYWKDFRLAYDQDAQWPETPIEAVWSTAVQLGTTAAGAGLIKLLIPVSETNNLMTYFTIAFGMGVGMKNGFYRNWVNAGFNTLERVYRRSLLGVTFAVTYSIANKGGVSHLSLIDPTGLMNWGLLLANVALAKIGSDPISDFNRIRNEMRINTKTMTFIPRSELSQEESKPLQIKIGKKFITIPGVRITDTEAFIGLPGIKRTWKSKLKWQAMESPVVNSFSSFAKLFDQMVMGVIMAGTLTNHISVAETIAYTLLSKSFLLAQIPIGRYLVMKYGEKNNYEDAPLLRANFERWFTVRGLGGQVVQVGRGLTSMAGRFFGVLGNESGVALKIESKGENETSRRLSLSTRPSSGLAGGCEEVFSF